MLERTTIEGIAENISAAIMLRGAGAGFRLYMTNPLYKELLRIKGKHLVRPPRPIGDAMPITFLGIAISIDENVKLWEIREEE